MGVLREALVPHSLNWEGCLERAEAGWRGSGVGGSYASEHRANVKEMGQMEG